MLRLSTLLFASALLLGRTNGQDFQCRTIETALDLDVSKAFTKVAPGLSLDQCKNTKSLAPKITHWHVIAIPSGEAPMISMVPEGLVKPRVRSGTLKFDLQEDAFDELEKGDPLEAGVSIFLPPEQLEKVIVEGVNVVVEITNNLTSSELGLLELETSGVDNKVYVSSPNAPVEFEGSGVDNTVVIEAASGSSIELEGVDQTIRIKTPDDLDVTMSGVDQKLTIEGAYNWIDASGIDTKVFINGPTRCDKIDNSGISNSCSTTEESVTVPELSCVASTNIQQWNCNWGNWTQAAAVGTGVGVLVVLILLCGLSCWGCYKCCGGGQRREYPPAYPQPKAVTPGAGNSVMEAEVISHTSIDHDSFGDKNNQATGTPASAAHADLELEPEAEIVIGAHAGDADKDLVAAETGLGKTI